MLFAPAEKGQGLVEYAIILAFVAIVVIAVMRLLGPIVGNTFSSVSNSIPN
jgi:pilus assembly protein Flp/PilA